MGELRRRKCGSDPPRPDVIRDSTGETTPNFRDMPPLVDSTVAAVDDSIAGGGESWQCRRPPMHFYLCLRRIVIVMQSFARSVGCTALALLFLAQLGTAEDKPLNKLSPEEEKAGFKLLFDGKTTDGWRGYKMKEMPSGWKVIDGVLTRVTGGAGGKGAGGGDDIITNDQYGDFELRLEWRVAKGVNSGILYRAIEDAATSWHVAPEMQVLDNEGWHDKNKMHQAGALYDLYAPSRNSARDPGEWNEVKLVAKGNHVEHWLNGDKVVEYELDSDDWKERVAKSKFRDHEKFAKAKKGHIVLQDHSGKIEYRNVRLREIKE
jgi:hypothetical protein